MNATVKVTTALTLLLTVSVSHAYKIQTHDELSKKSVECSIMRQDTFMKNLGWVSVDEEGDDFIFKRIDIFNKTGTTLEYTTKQLIGWGSGYEDDIASVKRPLNHFFDPLRNKPLRRTRGSLLIVDRSIVTRTQHHGK